MHSKQGFTFIAVLFIASFVFISYAAGESENAVKQETSMYYTVKKGDTLWDISKQFFNKPTQWPELWSHNKQIQNPHLIYPGNRIRLYEKDGMIMIEQAPPEDDSVPAKIVDQTSVKAAIPEPKKQEDSIKTGKPESGPFYHFPWMDALGFIRQPALTPDAVIIKQKDEKKMISVGDIFYVQQSEPGTPELIKGGLYTIYRTQEEPIVDAVTSETIGIKHDIIGIAEISDILGQNPQVAEAKVIRSFDAAHIQDKLMPYKRQSLDIPITPSVSGLDGRILLTAQNNKLFAEAVAFINKGENDGIKPGQQYNVYDKEDLGPVAQKTDIGSITVVHTESNNSTVVITDVNTDLKPGTPFRTPIE